MGANGRSDKTAVEFGERMEELEVEKSEIDELEKLIRKVKEKVIIKGRRRECDKIVG